MHNISKDQLLDNFLNLFWLRPETAVWRTLDCLAMDQCQFKGKILDFGCGDGLFSLTRAGGEIDPSYDMFTQVSGLESFYENEDIYNHFNEESLRPSVKLPPGYRIDVGFDHKPALLAKAQMLDFYGDVVEGNGNDILPFSNNEFDTIFSNILYWLDNFEQTLQEFNRILTPGGKVILMLPSDTFRDYSIYQRLYVGTQDPNWKWLELLDRGMSEQIKQCKSQDDWSKHLIDAGFKITQCRRYMSKTVLEAWNIGLRPISPFLIEMANELDPVKRLSIKNRWIKSIKPLVTPLCELNWSTDDEHPGGFFMFELEKFA